MEKTGAIKRMNDYSDDNFLQYQNLVKVQKEIFIMYWSALKEGGLKDIDIYRGDFDPFEFVNQSYIGGHARSCDVDLIRAGAIVKIHLLINDCWHHAMYGDLKELELKSSNIEDDFSRERIHECIKNNEKKSRDISDKIYTENILLFFKSISENKLVYKL